MGEILKPAHRVYVAELLLEDNLRDNVREAALARDPELLPVAVMDVGYWSQLHDLILPWICTCMTGMCLLFSPKNLFMKKAGLSTCFLIFRDLRGSTLRYPAFVETPLPLAFLLVSRPASYLINNKTDLFQGRFVVSRSTGLEPVASTVTGWRDNQLHQDPKCIMKLQYLIPFVNLDGKKTSN